MSFLAGNRAGWLRPVVDFVFPPLCAGCGAYTDNPDLICDRCEIGIERYTHAFCTVCREPMSKWPVCRNCPGPELPLLAFADYVSPLKDIIADFKFHSVTAPVPRLAGELVKQFADEIASLHADALLPIPLHPSREYQRGYNQAELIAESLSTETGLPILVNSLIRTRRRKHQQRLPAAERSRNIKGVFEVATPPTDWSRVLLVDDVVTSGSTVREAAETLRGAGYAVVGVLALAHGA